MGSVYALMQAGCRGTVRPAALAAICPPGGESDSPPCLLPLRRRPRHATPRVPSRCDRAAARLVQALRVAWRSREAAATTMPAAVQQSSISSGMLRLLMQVRTACAFARHCRQTTRKISRAYCTSRAASLHRAWACLHSQKLPIPCIPAHHVYSGDLLQCLALLGCEDTLVRAGKWHSVRAILGTNSIAHACVAGTGGSLSPQAAQSRCISDQQGIFSALRGTDTVLC